MRKAIFQPLVFLPCAPLQTPDFQVTITKRSRMQQTAYKRSCMAEILKAQAHSRYQISLRYWVPERNSSPIIH